jgi:hypothetical protein
MTASPDFTVPSVGSAYTVDTLAENSDIAIAADNLAFLLILGKLINKPLSLKKIPYCHHKPTVALYLSNFSYYTSFIYGF